MADSSKKPTRPRRAAPLHDPSRGDPARPTPQPVVGTGAKTDAEPFDFAHLTRRHQEAAQRTGRRRRRSRLIVAGAIVLFCAAVGGGVMLWLGRQEPLVLKPIDDQAIDELGTLEFTVTVQGQGKRAGKLKYTLEGAPNGAQIDPETGRFTWRPTEQQGPGRYEMTVQVAASAASAIPARQRFAVLVREVAQPPVLEPIDEKTVEAGGTVAFRLRAEDPDIPSGPVRFSLGPGAPPGARIDPLSGQFEWTPRDAKPGEVYQFTVHARKAGTGGPTAEGVFRVRVEGGTGVSPVARQPAAEDPNAAEDRFVLKPWDKGAEVDEGAEVDKGAEVVVPSDALPQPPRETADASAQAQGDEIILELYRKNKLLSKTEYPKLRKVFADRFEDQHAEGLRQVFGEKGDELRQWLDAHAEIKEEFYLAIDPEHDNVPKVLGLLKELQHRFPKAIESYANLAIAVAVVWDDQRGAIHRSPRQQHGSLQPDGEVGAVENFQYFLDTENVMQGRAQFLPWEFLVHVVNHSTPLEERQWALQAYLPKRVMFGKCYGDVPYDEGMLKGANPRLQGRPHTLPNILQYGGVCAVQADFAARVGKSLGVPAFSVSGVSRFGENHAWVMWVELGAVTRTGFTFSLESHGRFRGDRYYVGNLNDPHTSQPTTDRQVELRLHTVGMDPIAKRQADLVMRAYPMLRQRTEMDTVKQLALLSRVIDFSPGNQQAWIALAKMSREGQITKANGKLMVRLLDRLFTTFANLPDFTWVVFDDLVSFQDVPKQRAALFGRLAALYEQAKRPDLSCEARLKFAEYLVADKRLDEAIQCLATAILLFPEEGNFVPKMLDKLEGLCQRQARSQEHLVGFYQQFLPKIPQHRDSRPSRYCVQMYQRGIQRFQEAGMPQLAQTYQAQLALLQAQRGEKQ